MISTLILLATYALVIVASQSYAGVGTKAVRDWATRTTTATWSISLGSSVFGSSGIGWFMIKLLLLMVLGSAAASTQTTILPTARARAVDGRLQGDP